MNLPIATHARSPGHTHRRFSPLRPRDCRGALPGQSPARDDVWRAGAACRALCRAARRSEASPRATASCSGQKTAPSGSPPFTAACCAECWPCRSMPSGPLNLWRAWPRMCSPKLAVGDAILLAKLAAARDGADHSHARLRRLAERAAGRRRWAPSPASRTKRRCRFSSPPAPRATPKGIVLTHGNVLASVGPIEDGAKPYMRYERLVHPLRILHTLPLSHVFGQTMGLWVPPIFTRRAALREPAGCAAAHRAHPQRAHLRAGRRAARSGAAEDAFGGDTRGACRARRESPQKLSPWRRWWRFRRVHREFGLKFWAFVSGGGALPGPLEQFWNALGFVLVQGYGMTETTRAHHAQSSFPRGQGHHRQAAGGARSQARPRWRGAGARRGRSPAPPGRTAAMRPREDEWLATGDIAERQESGELRFLGRKSEVIVTAAGVNIHPEDIEAAIEEQPEVAACAVVAMETPTGPEPCAVLACRGSGELRAGGHRARQCHAAGVPAHHAAGCFGRSPICRGPRRAR